MKRATVFWGILVLLLMALTVFAQVPVPAEPLPLPTVPLPAPKPLPVWAYPLGMGGMNAALLLLQRVAPKLPGWSIPFINLGLTFGGLYFGAPAAVASTVLNTGVISGGASLIHNVIKNVVRQDDFGTPSVPKPSF